jgi:hypothetical protein
MLGNPKALSLAATIFLMAMPSATWAYDSPWQMQADQAACNAQFMGQDMNKTRAARDACVHRRRLARHDHADRARLYAKDRADRAALHARDRADRERFWR